MTNDDDRDGVTRRVREGESVTERIVEAVAAVTGTEPLSLPALYGTIDPEALDALFRGNVASPPLDGLVVIAYAGCVVTVHADGEVRAVPDDHRIRTGPDAAGRHDDIVPDRTD